MLALVSEHTVLLLLNVVKLSIAEAADVGILAKNCGESLKALDELFLALYSCAVAPAVAFLYPTDSAVFAYKYRLCGIILLALCVKRISIKLILDNALIYILEYYRKRSGILSIIVNVEYASEGITAYVVIRDGSAVHDYGTGRILSLSYVIDHLGHHIGDRSAVRTVPGFVKGAPTDERGVSHISIHLLKPAGKEGIDIHIVPVIPSPVTGLIPYHISVLIRIVEEAGLEYLLVESCTVEAEIHRIDYILLKSLIGRSGIDTVGIEALIKNESAEYVLAVNEEAFLVHRYGTETEISVDLIKNLLAVTNGEYYVVKSAVANLPKMLLGKIGDKLCGFGLNGSGSLTNFFPS